MILPDEKDWNRLRAAITPITASVLILFTTDCKLLNANVVLTLEITTGLYLPYVVMPIALLLSFGIFLFTKRSNPPFPSIMTLISLIIAYFWLYFFSRIAVNIVRVLAYCIRVKSIFLLMTIYAIGNRLPIILGKRTIAGTGLGDMAMVGCLGSQIMLLIGFFITLVKYCAQLYFMR